MREAAPRARSAPLRPRSGRVAPLDRAAPLCLQVRDWSDLSRVKASAIADAVMSTPPLPLDSWLARFRHAKGFERLDALLAAAPAAK